MKLFIYTFTGLVVESGHSGTHFVPVYEGASLSHLTTSIDLGGKALTQWLRRSLLRQMEQNLDNFLTMDQAETLKLSNCRVSLDLLRKHRSYFGKKIPPELKSDLEFLLYAEAVTTTKDRDQWVHHLKKRLENPPNHHSITNTFFYMTLTSPLCERVSKEFGDFVKAQFCEEIRMPPVLLTCSVKYNLHRDSRRTIPEMKTNSLSIIVFCPTCYFE